MGQQWRQGALRKSRLIRSAQGFHIQNIPHHLIDCPRVSQRKFQQLALLRRQVAGADLKQAQRPGKRGQRCLHLVADRGDKLILGALKFALFADIAHHAKIAQMLAAIGLDLGGGDLAFEGRAIGATAGNGKRALRAGRAGICQLFAHALIAAEGLIENGCLPPQKRVGDIAEQGFDRRVHQRHAAVGVGHDNGLGHGIHHCLEQPALFAQRAAFGLPGQLAAQPPGKELDELDLRLAERGGARGGAGKVQRPKQRVPGFQRRPDIAFQTEILITRMGRNLLLARVVERGHIGISKCVQAIGAIDVKGAAGGRRPVRAVDIDTLVNRMIHARDDAEFKTKRLCAQLQELGDLVFDGKIRLDSKHIELPQRIIEIRQSVVKVVHHCLCRSLCT